jgi:hypothetical protein
MVLKSKVVLPSTNINASLAANESSMRSESKTQNTATFEDPNDTLNDASLS